MTATEAIQIKQIPLVICDSHRGYTKESMYTSCYWGS